MPLDYNQIFNNICVPNFVVKMDEKCFGIVENRINIFVDGLRKKGQSVDYYTANRSVSGQKAINDLIVSKWAECHALIYYRLFLKFPKCSVDFEIRENNEKGWGKDLPFNKLDDKFPDVHVKSCREYIRDYVGDYSWTFQKHNNNDRFGTDPLFDSPDSGDLITGVCLHNDFHYATICFTAPWKLIISNKLLKSPKKEDKKRLKECIYYKDLVNLARMHSVVHGQVLKD